MLAIPTKDHCKKTAVYIKIYTYMQYPRYTAPTTGKRAKVSKSPSTVVIATLTSPELQLLACIFISMNDRNEVSRGYHICVYISTRARTHNHICTHALSPYVYICNHTYTFIRAHAHCHAPTVARTHTVTYVHWQAS